MQKPTRKTSPLLPWLVALNVIALSLLGGRYLLLLQRQKVLLRQQAEKAASSAASLGDLNRDEAVTMFELSGQYTSGADISDRELDWFLSKILNSEGRSYDKAAARRMLFCTALMAAIPQMSPPQKEKLFQAMTQVMKMDSPNYEYGSDLIVPVVNMARLKDTRAIPIIRPLLDDPRSIVRSTAKKSLAKLEGSKTL